MSFTSWRGVVGLIQPTYRPGPLEELIRLLPEGIGVIPLFLGVQRGDEKEFLDVFATIKEKIAELAALKVDLIHPAGAPPFMLKGYQGEAEIVGAFERSHGIPIVTSGMTQVEAMRALGIRRMVGITYFAGEINGKYARYFTEAGFEVLGMEGISAPFAEVGRLSPEEIYAFTKAHFLKHRDVQGIYLLGSGWRVLEITRVLEEDLQVPVIHGVNARAWAIQKRLHVRQPVRGFGRLLEEMP